MNPPGAAEKWGISERRVQILCSQNCIPDVSKWGYMWMIPKDAKKPVDGCCKVDNNLKKKCYPCLLRRCNNSAKNNDSR
ncbi:MAG: DNA-binding protein [bacterium]|nr:DNA-binding protein [bacterium]